LFGSAYFGLAKGMGSIAGGLAIGEKPSDYVHSVTSHDLKTIQKQTCCNQGV